MKIILTILFFCVHSPALAENKKDEWKELNGKHFIIYYKKAPQDFVKEVEEMSERYYDEIADNLGFSRYKGWTQEDRAKIYIYDDDKDYQDNSRQYKWSHGTAAVRQKTIRTFPAAHGFFDSTLPHEIGHIIFREFIGFNVDIPHWMDEGVAMYQEKAKRFGSHKVVKEAIKNKKFLSLKELNSIYLSSRTPLETVELYYAESASIVYYMINELGQQRFVTFCNKIKDLSTFDQALKTVYIRFHNVDDLNKAWVRYLSDL